MNRKILILTISLFCIPRTNIYPMSPCMEITIACSLLLASGAAFIGSPIFFKITKRKWHKKKLLLQKHLPELYTLHRTGKLRALSPQEQVQQKKVIKKLNTLLGLTSQDSWKKQLKSLLKNYHRKTTTRSKRAARLAETLSFVDYIIMLFTYLTPICHKKALETLYNLEQTATSRDLTKEEQQEQAKIMKALQKKLHVILEITPSTNTEKIYNIANTHITKQRRRNNWISVSLLGSSLVLKAAFYAFIHYTDLG